MERIVVAEAARRLGVTPEAIRQRIRRGTIRHDKDDDGRLYVYLEPNTTGVHYGTQGVGQGVGQDGREGSQGVRGALRTDLASELKERVTFLESELEARTRFFEAELEARREELRRKDHLLAAALERVPPALEDPRETPSESPETASEGMKGVEVPIAEETRSWWRRFFDL